MGRRQSYEHGEDGQTDRHMAFVLMCVCVRVGMLSVDISMWYHNFH